MSQYFFCDAGPFKGQSIPIKGSSTIEVLCDFKHGRGYYKAKVGPTGNIAVWTGIPPACLNKSR